MQQYRDKIEFGDDTGDAVICGHMRSHEYRGHGLKKSISPEFPGCVQIHADWERSAMVMMLFICGNPCESMVSGRGSAFVYRAYT